VPAAGRAVFQRRHNRSLTVPHAVSPSCTPTGPGAVPSQSPPDLRLVLPFCFCLGIEDLRDKREEINRQILKEDEEKAKVCGSPTPRGGVTCLDGMLLATCEGPVWGVDFFPSAVKCADPERLGRAHQAPEPPE
jgi:hypothetical protein